VTLETGLRLISVAGMLILVVVGVLVLQTRDSGRVRATARQKALLIGAGGVAVIAAGIGLLI
jgi:hypothetical protein